MSKKTGWFRRHKNASMANDSPVLGQAPEFDSAALSDEGGIATSPLNNNVAFAGSRKKHGNRARNRLFMAITCFVGIYIVIGGRLVYYGMQGGNEEGYRAGAASTLASRPDILDRNGEVLATDIKTASLYAEPKKIADPDETLELLATVLPNLDWESTYRKLKSGAGFVWIQRGLTPRQQGQIMALGVPGIGFRTEKSRLVGKRCLHHVL